MNNEGSYSLQQTDFLRTVHDTVQSMVWLLIGCTVYLVDLLWVRVVKSFQQIEMSLSIIYRMLL